MADLDADLRLLAIRLRDANRSARNSRRTAERAGDDLKAAEHRGRADAYADAGKRLERLLRSDREDHP